ncbi:unnamed protein product (macronuclear) [Paramecium tetraurelia]|uniref:Uncharacterized protein n=1 Tax=Paramecium tetraurelia TaxID=5888 RepID=A0D016_PARTE|nr:uncharacterized protein GSPATT00039131001 [Paramecium tetraurelia]CAK76383.1 unnamed protein product [Paramecium tetraurelia]|eukprot:XP_001443780.1 hypothetical protein (macronuclear) [Paramecium tetraurelia strain d4-2]
MLLSKIQVHEFSDQNYLMDEYEEFKKNLIIKILQDKKIIEFLEILVHLTAIDATVLIWQDVTLKDQNGINLNQAKLFKWKNLRINELSKKNVHRGKVNKISFSPDGMSLASCSNDNSICLWDLKTGKIQSVIRAYGEVESVCFQPNDPTLPFSSGECYTYAILKQRKTSQNQMVIIMSIQSISLQMFLHQHVAVEIIQSVYERLRQDNQSNRQTIAIKIFQLNFNFQYLKIMFFKKVVFIFTYSILANIAILLISQNIHLQAIGALILKCEFVNYQGINLKSLFKSKGGCILEKQIKQQKQQN